MSENYFQILEVGKNVGKFLFRRSVKMSETSRKWYFSHLLNWTRWFRWAFQNFKFPNFSPTFWYTFIAGIFWHFYPHFPTFLRMGRFSDIFSFPKQKNLESLKNFPTFLRVTDSSSWSQIHFRLWKRRFVAAFYLLWRPLWRLLFWILEKLKKIILTKMRKFGIQSSILTVLSMRRFRLITKEKAKKSSWRKIKKWSELESLWWIHQWLFGEILEQSWKSDRSEETKRSKLFTPKLTKEELKLVQKRNREHLLTYADSFNSQG